MHNKYNGNHSFRNPTYLSKLPCDITSCFAFLIPCRPSSTLRTGSVWKHWTKLGRLNSSVCQEIIWQSPRVTWKHTFCLTWGTKPQAWQWSWILHLTEAPPHQSEILSWNCLDSLRVGLSCSLWTNPSCKVRSCSSSAHCLGSLKADTLDSYFQEAA